MNFVKSFDLKIDLFHLVVESKQKNRQGIIQVSLLYMLKIGNEQCRNEENTGSKQSQSLYSLKGTHTRRVIFIKAVTGISKIGHFHRIFRL